MNWKNLDLKYARYGKAWALGIDKSENILRISSPRWEGWERDS